MDEAQLRALMEQVREGSVDVESTLGRLRHMPFEDLGFAKVDHHRALRQGMPEVIFAMGKTPEQVAEQVEAFEDVGVDLLLLQCSPQLEEMERFGQQVIGPQAKQSNPSGKQCAPNLEQV